MKNVTNIRWFIFFNRDEENLTHLTIKQLVVINARAQKLIHKKVQINLILINKNSGNYLPRIAGAVSASREEAGQFTLLQRLLQVNEQYMSASMNNSGSMLINRTELLKR